MSRVITFSTVFPSYHPRKGERTFFIEKIVEGMLAMGTFEVSDETLALCGRHGAYDYTKYDVEQIKYHTIRAGKRWKVGDKFSPRIWSGKPYASKQIIIADDIEIKKIWDFEMKPALWFDECEFLINNKHISLNQVAKNDGLVLSDFISWFAGENAASSKRKLFIGQIICWNENIEY